MHLSATVNLLLCSSSSQRSFSRPPKSHIRSQSLRCIPSSADPARRENLPRMPSCVPDGHVRKRSLKSDARDGPGAKATRLDAVLAVPPCQLVTWVRCVPARIK